MAYWMTSKREKQAFDYIQRFDPCFWTIDFPRPMMGSVVTTAADSLRVDLEFYYRDALAGLIWDSLDSLDHPLLAYETNRDYSRTILRFRWRSANVVPLDEPHGPTLTIEGRDEAGQPRSWYVRLWNYAEGTPEDALIELRFSHLISGWAADEEPVYPADIARIFISLTPPSYEPSRHDLLPDRIDGWIELSGIDCDGERSLLEVGDILLPPHEVRMCTAYDDSYNQTPKRLLRSLRGLGYRSDIVHYVGMSHYFRLDHSPGQVMYVDRSGQLAGPCTAWHRSFLEECLKTGYKTVLSLSYELFDAHCPQDWKQRFWDGTPAQTGWTPPSTVLSPANEEANEYLRDVAERFVRLAMDAGMPIAFQIGEPWWWQAPDKRIALYDNAALVLFRSRLNSEVPEIPSLLSLLDTAQLALLDEAGHVLGNSVLSIRDRVKAIAGEDAQTLVLLFTPTVLDQQTPEAFRANVPVEWAWPSFERLQLEDYDWLTENAQAHRRHAYATMQDRLNYPFENQDYLAGFVLQPRDASTYWNLIDAGIDEAQQRGVTRCFVWALPQVSRDGYTRLAAQDDGDKMQAFDDVLYPLALGRDAGVSPEFSTTITVTASGHERRNSLWADARLRFDVGPGIRSESELGILISFFRARRGAARGFRLTDPFDFSSNGMSGIPTPEDQIIATGDGRAATFQLIKRYGTGDEAQLRQVTRPRADTVRVSVAGLEVRDFVVGPGGTVTMAEAPPLGAPIRAGYLFDVPVRFAEDRLDVTGAAFAAGEAPSVPLIEVREGL